MTTNGREHRDDRGGDRNPRSNPAGGHAIALIEANPQWSLALVAVACVVGALLLGIGLWGDVSSTLDGILSTTLIVSGLALVFGAFGAQATVRYKSWVIAGVGATALIFLFAVDYLRRDSYVIIELSSSQTPTTELSAGDARIKGAVTKEGKRLRTTFFVPYKYVDGNNSKFEVDMHKASDEELMIICLGRKHLIHRFGRARTVDWRLDEKNMEIIEGKDTRIGGRKDCPGYEESPVARLPSIGISSAHAQSASDINSLIEDLLSENTDVRRITRDQLAAIGAPAIRPLMDSAGRMTSSNDRLAFRMQVGAAVAIDRMLSLNSNLSNPSAVSAQLTAADFDTLIQWTLNRDQSLLGPTLRILASTADLATLQKLMRVVEHQENENIIYNTAWILRQSAQRYRTDSTTLAAIKKLSNSLRPRSPGDKTTKFLNDTEAM